MRKLIVIAVWCLVFAGVPVLAAEQSERGTQPIQIKSDELFTDSGARTATFTGKVTARQADITINADKLVVVSAEKDHAVDRVEAFGNVRISQGTRLAQAGHAVYENKTGKIVLDNSPTVFQGDNVVTGKVITYFVNDERSMVTGGPGERVNAVIHPKDKGKNDGARP